MPRYARRRRISRRPVRRVPKSRLYSRGRSRAFPKRVRAVISRMAETKTQRYSLNNASLTTNPTSNLPTVYESYNAISQGTAMSERIGKEVFTKSLTYRGIMKNNSAANVYVRVVVAEVAVTDLDYFTATAKLLVVNGLPRFLEGTLRDIFWPWNNTVYRKHYDKVHQIEFAGGDYPTKMMKFYIPFKRRQRYGEFTVPETKRLVTFFFARRADSDEPVEPGDTIEHTFELNLNYTDT